MTPRARMIRDLLSQTRTFYTDDTGAVYWRDAGDSDRTYRIDQIGLFTK